MLPLPSYAIVLVVIVIGLVLMNVLKHRRRIRLLHAPAPDHWEQILKSNLPMTARLSPEQKRRLFGYMQVFLVDKHFEGCGGQEITEEIRVTVAAQACLLLVGRDTKVYPRLKSVLIYPHAYESGQKGMFGGDNGQGARLGESWNAGVVVLAWDSVLGGARNIQDGHNVTLHEFAHQLDQEDGVGDGAPILQQRSAYVDWARIFQREYDELVNKTEHGHKSTLDEYGATNPAEFFAVATETFFEKPQQLKTRHPELYDELQSYYQVDPMRWQ